MNRQLLALAVAATLATTLGACGGGGSGDGGGGGGGGGGNGGTTPPPAAPGGGGGTGGGTTPPGVDVPDAMAPSVPSGPPGATKAGTYVGDFGSGQGVYVIDAEDNLAGISLATDGSATSLFGNLGASDTFSGTLRRYVHPQRFASDTSARSFGVGEVDDAQPEAGPFTLNIVNGQTIEGGPVQLVGAAGNGLMPATPTAVAGNWVGRNRFCDGMGDFTHCVLVTDVTFAGTTVTGETRLEDNAGDVTFVNPIAGQVSAFDDVLLTNFNWGSAENENTYQGAVFFARDGSGDLILVSETRAELPDGGRPTIAARLSRP